MMEVGRNTPTIAAANKNVQMLLLRFSGIGLNSGKFNTSEPPVHKISDIQDASRQHVLKPHKDVVSAWRSGLFSLTFICVPNKMMVHESTRPGERCRFGLTELEGKQQTSPINIRGISFQWPKTKC